MAHIIDITMDLSNRRELMEIIRAEFADWHTAQRNLAYKVLHSDVANAHQGSPMGMVTNENLHLFRQYRNRVSADPAVMLEEAGFTNPAKEGKA